MKLAAAAQATSRTFLAAKCQVSVGLGPAGREDGCPTSAFVMIATVVSDRTAWERRARWPAVRDRKSTRLNSSHGYISYAVFCLKKKKNRNDCTRNLHRAHVTTQN